MNIKLSVRLLSLTLVTAACPALAGLPAGQPLETALTGPPGCEHVLDLLLRYGPLEGGPGLQCGTVVPSAHGPFVMPAEEIGDLCIASVTESPASDPACAPTFLVAITNNSLRAVCDVQVSLVALLGPIKPCDPTAIACLKEIPAGATVEIEITLPVEALAMGSNGGAPVGFQKLLVAIDSLDRYVERCEANNLKLLCRADIPQAVVEVSAPAAIETVPAEGVPAPQAAVPPSSLESALEEFGIDAEGETTAIRL